MPMYEYRCLDCESHFDRLRRMDQDDSDVTCPDCQSARIQRRLSLFATGARDAVALSGAPAPSSGGGCCGGGCCSARMA
ncbi:MAG: zinc ribbon domain-containing protein [Oscillochloridaceae bacterium]|nr:zinc ribbon domain-containing protein [Oscillochloridaceae bacterium]